MARNVTQKISYSFDTDKIISKEFVMKTWDDLTKHSIDLQKKLTELTQRHDTLQSFQDAIGWDNDAEKIIKLLQDFQNNLNYFREENIVALQRTNQERNKGPFLQKLFSSRSSENGNKENIRKSESGIISITNGMETLRKMMDKTPASKSEQKEIADELRQLKKELTLQKCEINENMRQARTTARQKTISYTGVNRGMFGDVARLQRHSARFEKERALVPLEGQKTFIEKKLIAIERDLNWVLHFRGKDDEIEAQSLQTETATDVSQRCSYC